MEVVARDIRVSMDFTSRWTLLYELTVPDLIDIDAPINNMLIFKLKVPLNINVFPMVFT